MSYPFRVSIAVLMVVVALVFLLLGALELADDTSEGPKAHRLFFSLAAICAGAAAGVAFA